MKCHYDNFRSTRLVLEVKISFKNTWNTTLRGRNAIMWNTKYIYLLLLYELVNRYVGPYFLLFLRRNIINPTWGELMVTSSLGLSPEQHDETPSTRARAARATTRYRKLANRATDHLELVGKGNLDRNDFEASSTRSVFEQKTFGQFETPRSVDTAWPVHGICDRAADPWHLVDVVPSWHSPGPQTWRHSVSGQQLMLVKLHRKVQES